MSTRALALVTLLVYVAGCGAHGAPGVHATYGASGGSPAVVGNASAQTSHVQAPAEPEPHPSSRPGLATQWGEQRASHVRMTQFVRASSSPSAVAVVRYNDAQGAAAQAALVSQTGGSHLGFGTGPQRVLVSLVDEYGNTLPAYRVNGDAYVVGQPGLRYSIRIENQTPFRFEAVVSVDGLDVVDGRDASFDKRGYILHPGGVTQIDGFRTSTSAVAAFRFGSVGTSYAAQTTGSARNVGVVGVALFAEAGARVDLFDEALRREQANPFPGGFAAPPPGTIAY